MHFVLPILRRIPEGGLHEDYQLYYHLINVIALYDTVVCQLGVQNALYLRLCYFCIPFNLQQVHAFNKSKVQLCQIFFTRYYKRAYHELFLAKDTNTDKQSAAGDGSDYHRFGWLLFLALRAHAFSRFKDLVTCTNGLVSILVSYISLPYGDYNVLFFRFCKTLQQKINDALISDVKE